MLILVQRMDRFQFGTVWLLFKDSAFFCYCMYVLCNLGSSKKLCKHKLRNCALVLSLEVKPMYIGDCALFGALSPS